MTPQLASFFRISTRFIFITLSYLEIIIYLLEIQVEYNAKSKYLKGVLLNNFLHKKRRLSTKTKSSISN
ncbi:hypothetical protein, partial [Enterococcus cecorum]|uniref:hypothetical protein n=1 Tax=Enterococcus cecorum TaxID=44008 RepID=UPI001FAB8A8A